MGRRPCREEAPGGTANAELGLKACFLFFSSLETIASMKSSAQNADHLSEPRILVLVAHPDDAEISAGGFLARRAAAGSVIDIISLTDGRSGHQSIPSSELVQLRRQEAAAAGRVLGASYITWDFPDGGLLPTLELRTATIAAIRRAAPDLILTHRANDYHPDHRAVGQVVQDACYLVRVPKIAPDVPPLRRDPVVALMNDHFRTPNPLRPDVVLDVSPQLDTILDMMSAHASQFFDWLPWIDNQQPPPSEPSQRRSWLRAWYLQHCTYRQAFWPKDRGPLPLALEALEFSEYSRQPTAEERARWFASIDI